MFLGYGFGMKNMKEVKKFVTPENAAEIIKALFPNAQYVSFVEHGYDNLVALVDETYAVRFPRNENAFARQLYEQHILKSLEHIRTVRIPKGLQASQQPAYVVTSFLPGRHLTAGQVAELPLSAQKDFALTVAQFAYELHNTLSVEKEQQFRKTLNLDSLAEDPWNIYFQKMFAKQILPPKQDELAKQVYHAWKGLNVTSPIVVVHDDLHTDNMLFEDDKLTGILDFGDTNIGTPEQELRQMYRISEGIMEMAITAYNQLSGLRLNRQAVKAWAIMQELAAYMEHWYNYDTEHPAFVRTCHHLNRWLPEGKWGNQ